MEIFDDFDSLKKFSYKKTYFFAFLQTKADAIPYFSLAIETTGKLWSEVQRIRVRFTSDYTILKSVR